jgi:hypothetical protein
MDKKQVKYLEWFKEREEEMNPSNDLAHSSVYDPQGVILNLVKSKELPDRLDIHDACTPHFCSRLSSSITSPRGENLS